MDSKRKRALVALGTALTLVVILLALSCERQAPNYAHISLYVIDAYTLRPLEGATIVLPESGITGESNARGTAFLSSIPIDTNSAFNRLTGAEYGEITMLIYAKGYLPCVWFKVHMYPSRIRSGPTIYMFPEGSEEVKVTVFTEAPEDLLMQEFVRRFAPAQ